MTTFTSEDRLSAQENYQYTSDISQGIFSRISEVILEIHSIASQADNFETILKLRLVADDLAKIGNEYYELKNKSEEL
jgi:hypothetical protein